METGIAGERSGRPRVWGLLAVFVAVLLIRLPFLNQAIQGDDHIYLTEAAHALVEPLHPGNVQYVFLGSPVDLRGHSHPPLNAWFLAGLIAIFGDVREVPFHAAYIVFSLLAAWAMWTLAERFSPRPLWACLLLLAVPAFVVNGGSLEADLPFLAFWLGAVALFVSGRLGWAAACMAGAAMAAYQAVFLIPILGVYAWLFHRREKARWAVLLTPALTIAAWQLFERLTTGAAPASVLAGHFSSYGFRNLQRVASSALMLLIHSWFIIFPALVPPALALAWRKRREPGTLFLLAWVGLFLACSMIVFFAGSARYLLPMAPALAILASRLRTRWLAAGFAAQLALSLGLAAANYQHWDASRRFAASLKATAENRRVWVDAEFGLRHYLERDGALPLTRTQALRAGDIVATSEMEASVRPQAPMTTLARADVIPAVPLRLIGLESRSGYSAVAKGFWPFGISAGVVDRLRADLVSERRPTLLYVSVKSPDAKDHLVAGVFPDGWMDQTAVLALKSPPEPAPVRARFYIAPNAPARKVWMTLDGREAAVGNYSAPGLYTLESKTPLQPAGPTAVLEIAVDRTFNAPGDTRDLGVVLIEAGFVR